MKLVNGCYEVVRGATDRGFAVLLNVSVSFPATGTTTVACGLSAPLSEFFLSFALFPSCPLDFLILFFSRLAAEIFYFLNSKLRLLFFTTQEQSNLNLP
jgi:hypothetical protein